jgi:hypothetical protein
MRMAGKGADEMRGEKMTSGMQWFCLLMSCHCIPLVHPLLYCTSLFDSPMWWHQAPFPSQPHMCVWTGAAPLAASSAPNPQRTHRHLPPPTPQHPHLCVWTGAAPQGAPGTPPRRPRSAQRRPGRRQKQPPAAPPPRPGPPQHPGPHLWAQGVRECAGVSGAWVCLQGGRCVCVGGGGGRGG